jgi:Transglycosylase SLT domain
MSRLEFQSQHAANVDRAARAIGVASERTGIDFDYLMNQAKVESGFRPDVKAATSSASGLFQFTKQTWLATVKQHGAAHGLGWAADAISANSDGEYSVADAGLRSQILDLRNQPELASLMAAEFASDNKDILQTALGREPQDVDLYLAHFLGVGGASKFLKNWQADSDQPAAPLFPKAAAANQAIFYGKNGAPRSLNEIRQRFAAKMGSDFAPAPTARAQFAQSSEQKAIKPLQLQGFQPMPQRLSIDFARAAYGRLSDMGARG